MGYFLIGFAVIFGIAETVYFGSNLTPQSTAEVIFDAITVLIAACGIFKLKIDTRDKKKI